MPPKKRQRTEEPPAEVGKKSVKAKSSVSSDNEIDYDKLAEAIVRKQAQSAEPNSKDSAKDSVPNGMDNQSGTVCSDSNTQIGTAPTHPIHVEEAPQTSGMTPANVQMHEFPAFLQNFFLGGESMASTIPDVQPLSLNDGIQLGANVPLRVKQKIWSDQFVDLKTLLPSFKESTVSIQIEQNSLSFTNTQKSQNQLSIHQWTTAFITFMAIYIEKKPEDAPHLLKYCNTIREISASSGDSAWKFYDDNFRKLRQSNKLPWQRNMPELMVSACTMHRSQQPFRKNFRDRVPSDKGTKFCYNFNNGTKCKNEPCRFQHICQICKESHPKIKCTNRKPATKGSGGTDNSKPANSKK